MFLLGRLIPTLLFYGATLMLPGFFLVRVLSPEMSSSTRFSSAAVAGCLSVLGVSAVLRELLRMPIGRPSLLIAAVLVAVPCMIILRRREERR